MFNLEKLSKIRGAKTDNNIIDFFNTLDEMISDKDVEEFSNKIKGSINIENLRDDDAINNNNNNKIIENFPDNEGNYLKIPKVIN